MKTTLLTLTAFISLCFISCSNSDNENNSTNDSLKTVVLDAPKEVTEDPNNKYGIKSGIVTYEPFDVMGMKTTQVTTFDDYGKKEVQDVLTEGEMMGFKTKNHSVKIIADGYMISYELENIVNGKNQAKKIAHRTKITDQKSMMDFSSLTAELKTKYHYKEDGTETIAGVEGTKFSMTMEDAKGNTEVTGVVYKNVMLKSEVSVAGMKITLLASKFDENADIPASVFDVPEGYTIQDDDLSNFNK